MENGLNSCIFICLKAFEFFPSGTRRTVLKMTFLKKPTSEETMHITSDLKM